jgi:hypothetical protein
MRLRALVLASLLLLAVPMPAGAEPATLLPDQGPTVPGLGLPVATIPAIVHFLHSGDGPHFEVEDMPTVAWNRVLLVMHSAPFGDPWDRTFRIGIEGTEVLHGTTPRGDFTVTQDITEYSSLLRGPNATVWSWIDSWVGNGIYVDVTLQFYDDPTAAQLPRQPFDQVASPFRVAGLGGSGSRVTTTYDFGSQAPTSGLVELITTGHTPGGEFWYQQVGQYRAAPRFLIYVDGVHVGTVHAMPYIYAFVGFCCGVVTDAVNQVLWGPAVVAQEAAGVHAVGGKTPSYRAEIPGEVLPLLQGSKDVRIVRELYGGSWPTSLNFLLEHA